MAWPLSRLGPDTAESLHIELDGIQQSAVLQLVTNETDADPTKPLVWLADRGFGYDWDEWCGQLTQLIHDAQYRQWQRKMPLQWPVVIVYFGDDTTLPVCRDVQDAIGRNMVKYVVRSVVHDRIWNKTKQWVNVGHLMNMTDRQGTVYHHAPLIVRTDTVVALHTALASRNLSLSSSLERLERPMDMTHFWPIAVAGNGEDVVGPIDAKLRFLVSRIMADMAADNSNVTVHGRRLKVHVNVAGTAFREGRRSVATSYIDSLLQTKIVVIVQRDRWEDHYRLFEGLVSGAMVLCDRMLSMPSGLEHGRQLVEFTSAQDFAQKALFYLEHEEERCAIARAGRKLAMAQHRSWHRMEEIIFGRRLTVCADNDDECIYSAHADMSRQKRSTDESNAS